MYWSSGYWFRQSLNGTKQRPPVPSKRIGIDANETEISSWAVDERVVPEECPLRVQAV